MAILSQIHCNKCNTVQSVMHSPQEYPRICSACRANEARAKKDKHLEELSQLSIEQRLRLIEEWIYNYKPYQGEPRF